MTGNKAAHPAPAPRAPAPAARAPAPMTADAEQYGAPASRDALSLYAAGI